MIPFTLYTANTTGDPKNCYYPNQVAISNETTFEQAVAKDHVMAKYQKDYRNTAGFIQSDCLPFDCDNDHSDNPDDWIEPFDIAMEFPAVCFAVSYSRSHNQQKGNVSARPRFHVFFPINTTSSETEYVAWKKEVAHAYPYFDSNALDSARFLYGANQGVEFYDGTQTITDYLAEQNADAFAQWENAQGEIGEGGRNNAMSHVAGKLLVRYGATEETYEKFLEQAAKCNPPLEDTELQTIWGSAVKFGNRVSNQEGYIPPELFGLNCDLRPTDYSDVGQACVLAREYGDKLAFSPSTDYMVYNGSFWEESKQKAQAVAQELTERQLEEAENEVARTVEELKKNGAWDIITTQSKKKALAELDPLQTIAFNNYESALEYKAFAVKRRDTKNISAALKEATPMLLISPEILDSDEFLLNTPSCTLDLRTGDMRDHNGMDYITKQTTVDPSEVGRELWLETLDTIFVGDQELIDYVQKIVGLCCVGKVYVEALIIAFGEGSNGKSTFWNVISRVLGTYGGSMSADILTVGCRRNVKPELAEAKGKRMLIAAELEEGMRLSTSNVKQLCSTDKVVGEKKFKDSFDYIPTHTLILYTNHLPKVGASDKGTWRRLIVIPFLAKIQGTGDKKNFADHLFHEAGGAILQWILEGAKAVIADDFHFTLPQKVLDAIQTYKENNDWLGAFLEECCELDVTFTEKSGELFAEYRAYCLRMGEYARSTSDFYSALEFAGFTRKRKKQGVFVRGLRLKSDFE